MSTPTALKNAKKIAETSAGRKLSYDHIWIAQALGGYQVRYTIPRTEGFFICNQLLDITDAEFSEYENEV